MISNLESCFAPSDIEIETAVRKRITKVPDDLAFG